MHRTFKAIKPLIYTFLTAIVSLALSSCTYLLNPNQYSVSSYQTPTGSPAYSTTYGNSFFVPTKGTGSSYTVGESIAFQVRSPQSGYMSLTVIDPDGSTYVLGQGTNTVYQNIPVRAGEQYSMSGFSLTPPRGIHRIQAAFSTQPITNGNVVYYVDQNGSVFRVEEPNGNVSANQVRADANIVLESYFYLR